MITVRYDEETGASRRDADRDARAAIDGATLLAERRERRTDGDARDLAPLAHGRRPVSRRALEDIAALNQVFSDAFTERYRRDGMVGVRVPFLNPAIWRYAIEDADDGAMLWRDERGDIAAFNMVHRSGVEGWMGPLAVRTEYQGSGIGKEIVARGVEWLKREGATVIGLETMPRTMDNIGFYSRSASCPAG